MKLTIQLFLLISFSLMMSVCQAQADVPQDDYGMLQNHLKKHILIDKRKIKFCLDSLQITISAIDSNGKTLWKTDPYMDSHLSEYRFKRPIIVEFDLGENDRCYNTHFEKFALILFEKIFLYGKIAMVFIERTHREVIWISYDNTTWGTLDKQTGEFYCFGNN